MNPTNPINDSLIAENYVIRKLGYRSDSDFTIEPPFKHKIKFDKLSGEIKISEAKLKTRYETIEYFTAKNAIDAMKKRKKCSAADIIDEYRLLYGSETEIWPTRPVLDAVIRLNKKAESIFGTNKLFFYDRDNVGINKSLFKM